MAWTRSRILAWRGISGAAMAAALWLAAAPAFAASCPSIGNRPEIVIKTEIGEPEIDRSLGVERLKAIVQNAEQNLHLTRGLPLGLTVAPIEAGVRTRFHLRRSQGGGYCVWLVDATVSVGFESQTIYVNRDYAPGSCQYRTIVAHEQQHVKRNRDAVTGYLPKMRRTLARVARGKPFIRVLGTERQARDAYVLFLRGQLEPILRDMEAARQRANAAIDTEESYRALLRRCETW